MGDQTDSNTPGSRGPAVVYFAKVPAPGRVKTRLVPPLTELEASHLYTAFLREVVVPIEGARTLVYGWPEDALSELQDLLPSGVELRPQRGTDLWERMRACLAELFAEGHRPVLIRNTDSPDLARERIAQALDRSGEGVAVFGPDDSGGYYLTCLWSDCPELFGEMEEHSATAFAQSVARAGGLGLRVEVLPVESDVDTFDDLVRMWRRRGAGQ